MNTTFNSALKQSQSIKKDLASLGGPTPADSPSSLTPASLGALSASLTAFNRTLDEYNSIAKQEPNKPKQEKAFERIRAFRAELADYRAAFDALKQQRDDAVSANNRSELLGRRPYVSATPDNPYAGSAAAGASTSAAAGGLGGYGHVRSGSGGVGTTAMGSGDVTREDHALREQSFFASTNSALDEYIARGQAVLGDLGEQRDMLKNTQRRLYTAANTLGISGDTIRMVERRAREDKWIFWGGVVIFVVFVWLCLRYLR